MEKNIEYANDPLGQYAAGQLDLSPQELELFVDDYMDMQVLYRSAIREASNRLEILDDEFQFKHKRNPIHSIQTRLKTPQSVLEKLGRRNLKPNAAVMRQELTDIAGVRVICSYVNDIYMLADLLCAQDSVELVRIHDYIKAPKANGYRSLHVVIRLPIHFSDGKQLVPVEIQIRTIAMDFWASLEHDLRYKAAENVPVEIARELKECASQIAELDEKMQKIHRLLDVPSDGGFL